MDALVVGVVTLQLNGVFRVLFNLLYKCTVCHLSVLLGGIVCVYTG